MLRSFPLANNSPQESVRVAPKSTTEFSGRPGVIKALSGPRTGSHECPRSRGEHGSEHTKPPLACLLVIWLSTRVSIRAGPGRSGGQKRFFSGGCACSGAQRSNLQNVSAGSWRRGERLHTCLTYARIPLLGEAPGTAWGPSGGSMVTANTLFELRECCSSLGHHARPSCAPFGSPGEHLHMSGFWAILRWEI